MNGITRWLRSFRFAYSGIKYALTTQRNMKFHFSASFVVLLSALFFRLGKLDILFLLLAITLVIVTELINTAVEKAVDLAMPEVHPLAKIAKDVAAASVLVSAVFAAVVGMVVFYEPLERWINGVKEEPARLSSSAVWLYLALVAFTLIAVESRFSAKSAIRPSLWMAVSFSISTLISVISLQPLVAVLAYSLSLLFMFMLYQRKTRTWPALLLGAFIGTAVTILAFWLHTLL
ncbi:diacylglycerol kinase family protein [Paenibacillus sp. J2TS4]|uniref:diacylglycerol kinase family protein n=1 Tax=Paenibacillus sp. J2TS4 TaxID=2807194 RepID=UPI001B142A61|nr:diacylglycerol kinase family protein [Paenibacillus sp. J2TS4]GIP35827.1 diacylglycerol kinase [Paenibacillus sp. J2TS4]